MKICLHLQLYGRPYFGPPTNILNKLSEGLPQTDLDEIANDSY